ncbi:hypothetical protein PaecuDRAFT_2147 [Paenibacillus curdlanolyticus YK9]|uniref:Uncharacterized protein n=1 Tax=Paenibacillus curdlanolyticus YK9 TaxID=717606 RepID=E0I913_9BACL|nr:hypothetical protein [Paenibacillus curdlanolyticus]EFM10897.1 hypothetical protein PaecuDRAFT_2147 [Paenibacillus curdlanolyticus YK9]
MLKKMDSLLHRKFLKTRDVNVFEIGYDFPRTLALDKSRTINIPWFKPGNQQPVILFVMSAFCKACDLEAVELFVAEFPDFRYVLFFESNAERFEEIQTRFASLETYRCDAAVMQKQLNFSLYPCVIGLNSAGQAVACGLFNSDASIKRIVQPLIKVTYAR